jgi:hypothetical protein
MSILQINSVCGIGSTGRVASDSHTMLVSQGHQSTVAFGRDTATNCNQTIRRGSPIDNSFSTTRPSAGPMRWRIACGISGGRERAIDPCGS